jgi:hypothetical protein
MKLHIGDPHDCWKSVDKGIPSWKPFLENKKIPEVKEKFEAHKEKIKGK